MKTVRRGLNIPITGAPRQQVDRFVAPHTVALLGADYPGLRPSLQVEVGDAVRQGQPLFTDKHKPSLRFTAPVAGRVVAIHRGVRRVFQSLVIEVDAGAAPERFAVPADPLALDADALRQHLLDTGLWTALRTRPFGHVADPARPPRSIFVTAMDTHPLAVDPAVVIAEQPEAFRLGLALLTRLTEGRVFVCQAPGSELSLPSEEPRVQVERFVGPHPAGLPGTHIHVLDPVDEQRHVWYLGYQDVIAIGRYFQIGELHSERVIALAGPGVREPVLLRTLLGADVASLTEGRLLPGEQRIVSGSVLGGRTAVGPVAWLGRYHQQLSVLPEGGERAFLGWLSPGLNRFSAMRIYLSQFLPGRRFAFNTQTQGSPRAIVPIGAYEKVMPLDLLPTLLLRALVVGDTERAAQLGALELEEDDLALCSFVCPGKYEYGPILRDVLDRLEAEG